MAVGGATHLPPPALPHTPLAGFRGPTSKGRGGEGRGGGKVGRGWEGEEGRGEGKGKVVPPMLETR